MDKAMIAAMNLVALGGNPYPGRGIVVGLDETGQYIVQVYWIMGRSTKSRNRVFGYDAETGRIFTEIADPAILTEEEKKDLSLIVYNAMRETNDESVVTNGGQTDALVESRESFRSVLHAFSYEPDKPNFTPRISAASFWQGGPSAWMSILRRSPWSEECDRHFYEINWSLLRGRVPFSFKI